MGSEVAVGKIGLRPIENAIEGGAIVADQREEHGICLPL